MCKELEGAHGAEADTNATYEILLAQIEKYDDLENDVKSLSEFSTHGKRGDFAGFILINDDGQEIFSFGKYKDRLAHPVLLLRLRQLHREYQTHEHHPLKRLNTVMPWMANPSMIAAPLGVPFEMSPSSSSAWSKSRRTSV